MVGSGQTKKLQPELLEYNFWRKYGGCTKEAEYTTQWLVFMFLTHASTILNGCPGFN